MEFASLDRSQIGAIVELQTARVVERLGRQRGITLTLTEDARTLLGNLGYDPTYGARPLKRVIQRRLVDKLAMAVLQGEFREGDRVVADVADGEITLAEGVAPVSVESPAVSLAP